jgi:hypothetical protein
MLKALSRIDENKAQQQDSLPPLSAAELADLNARSCQGASGGQHPLAKTMIMPAEKSLDRAEALLASAEKSAPTVGDANRATLMAADLAPRPLAALAVSFDSFSLTVAAQFADADVWMGVALPAPHGDMHVELVEPACFHAPPVQVDVLTCDMVAMALDFGVSHQLQVAGDQTWRIASRIDPAPADSVMLAEPTTWEEKQARLDRQKTTGSTAATINKSTAPGTLRPLEISPKTRRQCEEVVAGLLRNLPDTESAVLLFTAVDGDTPPAPVLGPLASVLAAAGAGRVLLTDAHFGAPELEHLFAGDGSPALAAYLRGDADWRQLPVASAGESLAYVPGGDWQGGGGLPAGDSAAARWDELKARYRFVLIDADGLDKPAARHLVAASDGVYLLAALECSSVSATEQQAAVIRAAGGCVAGCVLVYQPVAP